MPPLLFAYTGSLCDFTDPHWTVCKSQHRRNYILRENNHVVKPLRCVGYIWGYLTPPNDNQNEKCQSIWWIIYVKILLNRERRCCVLTVRMVNVFILKFKGRLSMLTFTNFMYICTSITSKKLWLWFKGHIDLLLNTLLSISCFHSVKLVFVTGYFVLETMYHSFYFQNWKTPYELAPFKKNKTIIDMEICVKKWWLHQVYLWLN